LAILAASVFLTACEQEELQENLPNTAVDISDKISKVQSFIIQTPEGLSIEEAIEWAKNHKETAIEVEDADMDNSISSRYCTSWETYNIDDYPQRRCNCNSIHMGCENEYHDQEKWCWGWSSSCTGNYCVKRHVRTVTECVEY